MYLMKKLKGGRTTTTAASGGWGMEEVSISNSMLPMLPIPFGSGGGLQTNKRNNKKHCSNLVGHNNSQCVQKRGGVK